MTDSVSGEYQDKTSPIKGSAEPKTKSSISDDQAASATQADLIAETPDPPYYAVIFTSLQTDSLEGYSETAEAMLALAAIQDGFLGVESARSGLGITVSYWRDLESIERWKNQADHRVAKQQGISRWYEQCTTRIARVEQCYSRKVTSS